MKNRSLTRLKPGFGTTRLVAVKRHYGCWLVEVYPLANESL